MSKRIFSAILASLFILSSFGIGLGTVYAGALSSGDFTYTVSDGKVYITGYTGSAADITIPAALDGQAVYGIADEAFVGKNFTSVTISEGIQTLGNYVFEQCRNMTSIALPDSLTAIGTLCFNQDAVLPSIRIPKNVSSLGAYLFRDCTALKTVTVDDANANFKSVSNVIYSKDGKTLVVYPQALDSTSYTVLAGTETIARTAFVASSLTSVTLPDSLVKISSNAFSESKHLTAVTIPSGTTSIGQGAFSSCTSLTRADISASVESIDSTAFSRTASDFAIYGYNYSYAEAYANKNSIAFVSTGSFGTLIDTVVSAISSLGWHMTLDKKSDVEAIREAYDTLRYDTPQSYVTNYLKLQSAEKELAALEAGTSIPDYTLGDVDGDGSVTVSDVVELRGLIMDAHFDDRQSWASDLSMDNSITVSDVVSLRGLIMTGASY